LQKAADHTRAIYPFKRRDKAAMSSPWGAQPPKLPSMDFNFNQLPKRAIGAGAAAVAVLVLLFSTAYTIDEGERGVILRLGKVVGEAGPGLHFKIPFINTRREKSPSRSRRKPSRRRIRCRYQAADL
jgi:hypothetical protein